MTGKKPYRDQSGSYPDMARTATLTGMEASGVKGPHSELLKPWRHDDYQDMEYKHPINDKAIPPLVNRPQLSPGFLLPPTVPVIGQCLHLTINPPPSLEAGQFHQFTASGGDGQYLFRQFLGPGTTSAGGLYTAPLAIDLLESAIVVVGVTDGCRISKGALSRGANLFATSTFVVGPEEAAAFLVSDTFTDSDSTALESHTPEEGGAWTKAVGAGISITSNELQHTGSFGVYVNEVGSLADGQIEADADMTAATGIWRLVFRFQDSSNYYLATWISAGTGQVLIQKVEGGGFSTLGGGAIAVPSTFTGKVTFEGDALKVYTDDVLKASVTDSTFSTGKVGLSLSRTTGTLKMDNYVAEST